MPYQFRYDNENEDVHFRANVATLQCAQVKADGHRCRNKVAISTPFCWQHLLYKHHLKVKPSTIPQAGKGLFAESEPGDRGVFKRGQIICAYDGERITEPTMDARYGPGDAATAPYAVMHRNVIEDGALHRGTGCMANHAVPPLQNARLRWSRTHHRFELVAKRNIGHGAEILCDYGDEYRMNEPGVHYSTVSVRK